MNAYADHSELYLQTESVGRSSCAEPLTYLHPSRPLPAVFTLLFLLLAPWPTWAGEKIGFLILAPDRGFVGNRETQQLFREFAQEYHPAALAFTG